LRWLVTRLPAERIELARNDNAVLLIIDDEQIGEAERGLTLERFRQQAPHIAIVYVARHHDEETEKCARANGVLLYTAKPVDENHLGLILGQLLKMQQLKS